MVIKVVETLNQFLVVKNEFLKKKKSGHLDLSILIWLRWECLFQFCQE